MNKPVNNSHCYFYHIHFITKICVHFFMLSGGAGSMEEGGWSQPVGRTRQQPYSVETAKLKSKPVSTIIIFALKFTNLLQV